MFSTPLQGTGSPDSTSNAKPTRLTGESRLPFRERIQRMRGGKGAPALLRPGTPHPSKHTTSGSITKTPRTPRTPRAPLNTPVMPNAPRKAMPHGRRRLNLDDVILDEDILLDKKANQKEVRRLSPVFREMSQHREYDTPGRSSPLRQSWSPEELAEVSAKLRDCIENPGDEMSTVMEIDFTEPIKQPDFKNGGRK